MVRLQSLANLIPRASPFILRIKTLPLSFMNSSPLIIFHNGSSFDDLHIQQSLSPALASALRTMSQSPTNEVPALEAQDIQSIKPSALTTKQRNNLLWEPYKDDVRHIYVERRRPLREVMREIETKFQFKKRYPMFLALLVLYIY